MKDNFYDKKMDITKELDQIDGTSFWTDITGKLYEADIPSHTCWLVSPQYALMAVLKRAGVKNNGL